MKIKLRLLSLLIISGVITCLGATKMVDAGYYTSSSPAYFAYDTYVNLGRSWGHVYSANFECDGGSNQKAQYYSVLYYRVSGTGTVVSYYDYSGAETGNNPYAETYCYPPNGYEIAYITSIHNGYWNNLRQTGTSRDGD